MNSPRINLPLLPALTGAILLVSLALAGCGDDTPPPDNGPTCAGPGLFCACVTDLDCPEGELCSNQICLADPGTPDADMGADGDADADASTSGDSDMPPSDGDLDGDNSGEPDEADGDSSVIDPVDEPDGDLDSASDSDGDGGDADADPDGGDADGGDADGGDADVTVLPDLPDMGGGSCTEPDPLEPNDDIPANLHPDDFFAGSNALRSDGSRARTRCGAWAFGDCAGSDRCECALTTGLAAQGDGGAGVDFDWLSFALLAGDNATVRVIFDDPVDISTSLVTIHPLSLIASCSAPTECTSLGDGSSCIKGQCRTTNLGRPVDTNADAIPDLLEFEISGASRALDETDVRVEFLIQVASASICAPYTVLIQVDPENRECQHDAWDDSWDVYRSDSGSEVGCSDASCTIGLDEVGRSNLCRWDQQDWIRHLVLSGGATRTVDVLASGAGNVFSDLYVESGGDLVFIDRVEGTNPRWTETYSPLNAGTYQVESSARQVNQIDVRITDD